MNKIVLSSVVAMGLVTNVFAETKLDEVLVTTATKTQKNIDGVSASVIVVSQEEIEKMGAESLKDIINKTAGLNVQYGTFPSASSKSKSSISIRGMSANGTLFLLDGRRLAGEVKNPYDLDRIPASTIERIEIVKGPMSSLYGADATGGVINIITKKPTDTPQIDLNVRYGQNKDGDAKNKNASFSVLGKKDKFGYSLYANQTNTTPYTQKEVANVGVGPNKLKPSGTTGMPPNGVPPSLKQLSDTYVQNVTYREDSEISTVGGRFDYDFTSNTKVGFDFNYFKEDRDGSYIGFFHPAKLPNGNSIPIFNIPVNSNDKNKRLDLGLDFDTAITQDLSLKLKAYKSKYKKRNITTAIYYKEMGYTSENDSASNGMDADVDVNSYEAMLTYALNENHLFVAGTEYREEKREATVFSEGNGFDKKNVDNKSVYLQDEWQITDSLSAIIGARYDDISNADSKATFKVGFTNKFSNLLNTRILFAQGYRAPDLRELYINKNTPNGPNRGALVMGYDLKPEFTNTYEIGLGGRNTDFSYDVALFLNKINDRISEKKTNGVNTFVNIDKAETKGLELNLSYDILSNLSTTFNYTFLDTEDKTTKKDLDFNPNSVVMLSLSYQPIKDMNITPSLRYIGKQDYTETIGTSTTYKKTNDQTLVDLSMDYNINKNFNIYGGVNNIFNEKVDDILGSNEGTYYFAGVRVKF
ncbi:TonB-dependent receptor plug domain-containing protein [Aliarcobacter lanthieri]|uniref:TonB-dependent receptor plug domain-containing protein n=1 Tax=Aliarcobacter lanthieri TaxID=1355374 RepID=UPI003AB10157